MNSFPEFKEFKKIPRLSREIIITEKIDGTNGVIYIDENNNIFAGSRNRWLWGLFKMKFIMIIMDLLNGLKQIKKNY
jgi:hypothetical protein